MTRSGAVVALTGALLSAAAVDAADKPAFGPPPAWVKPVALPSDVKPDDAPLRVLLSDQQIAFTRGSQTVYSETALKIQTPQGLTAGNISLPWRPETDTLTVHKLVILRGDKAIDVLGAGQTFTILRREQNLESAMLDGVLTANIQPEGLQVGDVVDLAFSMTSSDPVLKGHVESLGATWNGLPFARAHLRAQWPNDVPVRLRQAGQLPPLKPVRVGDSNVVDLSLDNVPPVLPPKGAPLRYRIGRVIELSDFASWSDIGALMAPLYEKASIVPAKGALHDELARIEALSSEPRVRAEAALALVQDRVRYVALMMGQGGYVPADAETTWSRRYGDCKAKSALLLALLHAMGIEAEPVAVNAIVGDGIDQRLPMVALFNHVIVRATIAGKTYWLDGTRSGDTSLDRLRVPAFGWGLPMVARGAALVRMVPPPLELPDQDISISIDARAGVSAPAPAKLESVLRGDDALGTKIALDSLAGDARDRALREYWTDRYDFIEVKSVSSSFDARTGEEHLTMEGSATLGWANGTYQTDGTHVGYHADFAREPGPDRDAPFDVAYPYFIRMRETILLPKGQGAFRVGPNVEVDQTAGGIAYRRHATIADDVFTIEKTERSLMPEFAAKDAPAEQAALRKLDDQQTSIVMPAAYRQTGKDLDAARAAQPTSASDYARRGGSLADAGQDADALKDYDKAVELDPKDVYALTSRATLRVKMGDLAGARADLQKSQAVDPDFVWNYLTAGLLAEADHRLGDAIAAYTQAIEHQFDGHNKPLTRTGYPYWRRAQLYAANDMLDAALADFNKVLALDPNDVPGLIGRATIHIRRGNHTEARSDLVKAAAVDTNAVDALTAKAMLAELEQRSGDAISGYTAILDQQPRNVFALAHRAFSYAQRGDLEHAFDDAGAALKLEPTWVELRGLRAWRLVEIGKGDEALAEVRAAVTLEPKRAAAHVAVARTLQQLGRRNDALAEYGEAIAIDPQPTIYVERSFVRAEDDFTGRRADIDAALRLDPRSKEAVAASATLQQDQGDGKSAVAKWAELVTARPGDAGPLFERAKAYLASGDTDHALEDSAAALKLQPRAAEIFLFRANLYRRLGKVEEAVREAAAVEAAVPDSGYAHVVAANIYSAFHRDAEAIKAFDRALAVKPEAYIYLNRGGRRPRSDAAGRMADFEAALKLNPHMAEAIVAKATQQRENGDLRGAIATYDAAVAADPDQPRLLIGRGVAYSLAGDMQRADKDFADARAKGDSAQTLNEMCWSKAIAGVALDSALADCNAALGKQPENAQILDSRGFVELRLGRLEAAIADYDKALAKWPSMSNSLFGRAVARARQGDKVRSAADASAALKVDPDVRSDFERYGVKL